MMLSGPEYKTGYFTYGNHQTRDIFCITDEIGSALTWNGNLDWTDPELVKSHEIVKPYGKYFLILSFLNLNFFHFCQILLF